MSSRIYNKDITQLIKTTPLELIDKINTISQFFEYEGMNKGWGTVNETNCAVHILYYIVHHIQQFKVETYKIPDEFREMVFIRIKDDSIKKKLREKIDGFLEILNQADNDDFPNHASIGMIDAFALTAFRSIMGFMFNIQNQSEIRWPKILKNNRITVDDLTTPITTILFELLTQLILHIWSIGIREESSEFIDLLCLCVVLLSNTRIIYIPALPWKDEDIEYSARVLLYGLKGFKNKYIKYGEE
jgi:hypothetical protein